jgi:tetratricopeptide (TPR) repeat protein
MFKRIIVVLLMLASMASSVLHASLVETLSEVFKNEKIRTSFIKLGELEADKNYEDGIRAVDQIIFLASNELSCFRRNDEIIMIDPNIKNKFLSYLYTIKALYKCELGRPLFALFDCRQALDADKNNSYAYLVEARAHEALRDNKKAIACVKKSAQMGNQLARDLVAKNKW